MARSRRKNRIQPLRADHNREVSELPFNEPGAKAIVPDPFSKTGGTIEVTRAIRNDPLAGLLSRKMIDHAQFGAGRKWQAYYEAAGIGLVIAMDPLKEPVDGRGATRADFTDGQLYAFHKLKESRSFLGLEGYTIVRDVLGDGLQIVDVSKKRGFLSQLSVRYFGMRFRECLETIAQSWGMANGVHKLIAARQHRN